MILAEAAKALALEGIKRRVADEDARIATAVERNLRQLEAAIIGAANSGKTEAWYLISMDGSDAGTIGSRVRDRLSAELRSLGYDVFVTAHDPQAMSIVWR